jgi:dienelactone hydrolase
MKSAIIGATFAASAAAAAPPTRGPYATAYKRDYKITGADSGKLHVYYPQGAEGEKFPLISYAHGLAGGSIDLLGYAAHFKQLASWGFVVAAPNTCNLGCSDAVKSPYADCNPTAVTGKNPDADGWNSWFGEQIKAIEMARNLTAAGDAIFATVNWDHGVAIAGHSMGGQATAWTAHENCTSQWGIKTAAIQHGVWGTTNEEIGVPVIAMGGTSDASITIKTKDVFTKSPTYPKVFRDIVGGPHTEPNLIPNPLLATYTAAWFKYTLDLDQDGKYHDMIFGDNEDSLCNFQEMNECILEEHASSVQV